ncbi:GGDEF domain-containing protein [Catelliglobosispora koreensis]|uniref:GGDEF domain-containing protein n=1 Tax=Catelliglobosispora koreensis TaxID=129052 RepID=UPI00035DEAA5|nr:GGDEF domain-containing protein [Catelliglobosispora koreensis]
MHRLLLIAAALAAAFAAGRASTRPTRARLHAQLAQATHRHHHDPLTGLLNRTGLAAAYHTITTPHLIVLLDLDRFKHLNDTHGHRTGDHLLAVTGSRLATAATHLGGIAARLSGDEYAAILPTRHTPQHVAATLTGHIRQPVTADGASIRVTASLGICHISAPTTLTAALHHADIAMYHAKTSGGNTFGLHHTGMTMPTATMARQRGGRR